MEKYVIIDREFIEERIKRYDELYKNSEKPSIQGTILKQLSSELNEILSHSTPLIPEIVKSFNAGERYGWDTADGIGNLDRMKEIIPLVSLESYVSDLKF